MKEQVYSSQGEPRRRNVYILQHDRLDEFDPGGFEEWRAAQEDE